MAGDNIIHATDDQFDEQVLKSSKPVLVDFWASWCGPCQAIGPTVEELANEYSGRAVVAKMNVDENPKTPGNYHIRAIPTLILFKDGQESDRITGAVAKAQIAQMLDKVIQRLTNSGALLVEQVGRAGFLIGIPHHIRMAGVLAISRNTEIHLVVFFIFIDLIVKIRKMTASFQSGALCSSPGSRPSVRCSG